MNIKQYIFFLLLGALASWFAFAIIVLSIDPYSAGTPAITVFFATLFFALLGSISVITTLARSHKQEKTAVEKIIKISLRQGILLSGLVTGSLLLSHNGVLSWWLMLVLLFATAVIEYIFLSISSQKDVHNRT